MQHLFISVCKTNKTNKIIELTKHLIRAAFVLVITIIVQSEFSKYGINGISDNGISILEGVVLMITGYYLIFFGISISKIDELVKNKRYKDTFIKSLSRVRNNVFIYAAVSMVLLILTSSFHILYVGAVVTTLYTILYIAINYLRMGVFIDEIEEQVKNETNN